MKRFAQEVGREQGQQGVRFPTTRNLRFPPPLVPLASATPWRSSEPKEEQEGRGARPAKGKWSDSEAAPHGSQRKEGSCRVSHHDVAARGSRKGKVRATDIGTIGGSGGVCTGPAGRPPKYEPGRPSEPLERPGVRYRRATQNCCPKEMCCPKSGCCLKLGLWGRVGLWGSAQKARALSHRHDAVEELGASTPFSLFL